MVDSVLSWWMVCTAGGRTLGRWCSAVHKHDLARPEDACTPVCPEQPHANTHEVHLRAHVAEHVRRSTCTCTECTCEDAVGRRVLAVQ